jgi:hypothetical protein
MTPDGCYFMVRGHLWKCSNPTLSVNHRADYVKALMPARRSINCVKAGMTVAMTLVREMVDIANQSVVQLVFGPA